MRLHNPTNGVQISVDDETGDRLLGLGTYREGATPANWKAPKPGAASAEPVDEDADEKPRETAAQKRKREAEEKAEREAAEKAAAEAAAAGNGS